MQTVPCFVCGRPLSETPVQLRLVPPPDEPARDYVAHAACLDAWLQPLAQPRRAREGLPDPDELCARCGQPFRIQRALGLALVFGRQHPWLLAVSSAPEREYWLHNECALHHETVAG